MRPSEQAIGLFPLTAEWTDVLFCVWGLVGWTQKEMARPSEEAGWLFHPKWGVLPLDDDGTGAVDGSRTHVSETNCV
jgi:hypothetical protein